MNTLSLHGLLNRLLPRVIRHSIATFASGSYILKPRPPPNLDKPQPHHPQVRKLVFSLNKVLRHSTQRKGIRIRPDGYVRVRELLGQPEYQHMKLSTFINLIQQDPRQRFQLKEESKGWPGSSPKELWVRHHGRHSIKSVNAANKRITLQMAQRMGIYTAIFCTDMNGWQSFREHGIWSEEDSELIRLVRGIPETHGVDTLDSQPVLISVDVQKALRNDIMFYKAPDGSLVTEGDDRGCLSPKYFQQVVTINWEREALLHHNQGCGG
ncbi:hypothetical protein L218DRAFT_921394 [Marasmius fiardii PR-910]|nr:hypothetical protein L218DRAFT_921394 [Marasmius fiardii PR-910]